MSHNSLTSCFFSFDTGCDYFIRYENKRIKLAATTVLNTTIVPSEDQCILLCYLQIPGCLAVNFITTSESNICELTTGLSGNDEMEDNATSTMSMISMVI